MTKHRVEWLDCARGIGILMILLLHCATSAVRNSSSIVNVVYEGTMLIGRHLFFFLSGYTFHMAVKKYMNQSFFEFAKKKAKRLLIPYAVYAIFITVIFIILSKILGLTSIVESIKGSVTITSFLGNFLCGDTPYTLHLWFLYDLFFFNIVTYLILKLTKNKWMLLIFGALLYIPLSLIDWNSFIAITNIMSFYIWFALGYFVKVRNYTRKDMIRYITIAAISGSILIFTSFKEVAFLNNAFILFWLNIGLRLPLILLIIFLVQHMRHKLRDALAYMGKRSMYLYMFQQPFFGSCLATILFKFFHFSGILAMLITFIISIPVTIILSNLLEKTKYLKKIFGYI